MTAKQDTTIGLTRDLASIAAARTWLAEQIERDFHLSPAVLADTLVMASELVTNVLDHTRSVPVVTLAGSGDRLVVEVHDDDPHDPQLRRLEPSTPGGNGLRIVSAWAQDWGVRHVPDDGKVVWFSVSLN